MRFFWYGLVIVLVVLAVVNTFLFAVVCVGGSLVNAVVRDIQRDKLIKRQQKELNRVNRV